MEQLAERYGKALFELACEENQIDKWQKEANAIRTALEPEMKKFFVCTKITGDEKKAVLKKAFKDAISPRLLDFMFLLIDQHRFTHLHSILTSFNSLCNESKNIKEGIVYSARPLTNVQIQEIEKTMSLKMNCDCELVNRIDERLISGFRVVVDNEVVDTSMKSKINSMKYELLKGTR